MANGVYIFGGDRQTYQNHEETTSDFLPKNNNRIWQAGPIIPNGFTSGCGVKISEEEILLIGGQGDGFGDNLDRILSYNTRSNSFSTWESTLQQKRYGHECVLLNNQILVVGGRDYSGNWHRSTEVIPLASGTPRYGGNLNTARCYFGLAIVGDGHYKKAISFGGRNGSDELSSVEEWDEDTEQWKMAPYSLDVTDYGFASLAVPSQMVCP